MRTRVLWISLLTVGLFLLSGAAWAEKPEKDDFMFTDGADYRWVTCDDQVQEGDLFFGHAPIPCDNGILICELADAHITSTSFFDKDGNLTRYREKGTFAGSYYEYENYGNRLDYGPIKSGQFFIDYGDPSDPGDDTYNYRGMAVKVAIPGYGQMFIDAGHFTYGADWVTPVHVAGQHPGFLGDFGPVCDYLADN